MALLTAWLDSHLPLAVLSISIVGIVLLGISRRLTIDYDPREPPLIKSRIPIIGHILGIFWYGTQYYAMVNEPYDYPIYTLDTPGMRQYIVTSPQLAAQLQRSHKDLSFYSAITEVTRRLTGLPPSVMAALEFNMDGHEGRDRGIMPVNHDNFANVLARGEELDKLTAFQLREFSRVLNAMAVHDEPVEVHLLDWLQKVFTPTNILALYGPKNPISRDKSLVQSFWDFENGMLGLITDILPSVTMKKAYLGREKVVAALVDFVRKGHYTTAATVIRNRVDINRDNGLNIDEAGRSELVVWFAILGNAIPSTFWVILDIFTTPSLLQQIRQELRKAINVPDEGNEGSATINISTIKASCPLLVSCYRESLRLIGNLASIRYVLRDTVIGKQYLKGKSLIQVAGCIVHQDPKTWGENSCEFDPQRFVRKTATAGSDNDELADGDNKDSTATQLPDGVPSAAYRLFGGGSVTCPGRFFAQSEILGFVAYLIMAFDLTSPDGKTLIPPEKDVYGIPLTVLKPKKDIAVKIRRRKGQEHIRWELIS